LKPWPPRLGAAIAVALLALPGTASAVQIDGDPLVVASDDQGHLGIAYKAAPRTECCCGTVGADGVVPTATQSGFVLVVVAPDNSIRRFGPNSGNTTLTGPPVVTGTGSTADPFKLTTLWQGNTPSGAPLVEIKQELVYSNGDEQVRAVYAVRNLTTGQQLRFRAAIGADLAGGGADQGRGLLEAGPPRFAAGFNTAVGSVAGLAELTPWSHFEEGPFQGVLSRAAGDPAQNENLLDRVEPNRVDNGVAAQWDGFLTSPLAPGQTAPFEITWRFRRTFSLTPQKVDATTGDRIKFDVELSDPAGAGQGDVPIRWSIGGGPNSGSGDTTTRSSGRASFEIVGANPGVDTITAYADVNDNETRDPEEPQREAQITWTGPDAPKIGKEVNLKPVSGKVLIKLPGNAKVKGRWAHAAQSGFVSLDEVKQVPVGAELDTKSGRVQLTSSTSTANEVQTAQFYSGRFTVVQSAHADGLTEARLSEPLQCQPNSKGKLTAARRSRHLWGNGKGSFRTRGRHSAATVRGTIWLTKDSCSSTTTVVRSGTVTVTDFAKHKNVKVKKGKRYTARQRRRR
jgi:hypothetical protein